MNKQLGDQTLELGKKLKAYRKATQLTQGQLAERIGIDTQYYATIERGERTPSLKLIYTICRCSGIDPGDLLELPKYADEVDAELRESINHDLIKMNSKQIQVLRNFIDSILPLL